MINNMIRNTTSPTFESNVFGFGAFGSNARQNNFETTNSQYFRASSMDVLNQKQENGLKAFNGTDKEGLNSKEICPCCTNQRLSRIKSVNKENVEKKMKEIDQQMLTSSIVSLKLSAKRSNQIKRHHQVVDQENKQALEAKKQAEKLSQEQERARRADVARARDEEARREADNEKINEIVKKSIQKRLLNDQVDHERETKQVLQAEERELNSLPKSLPVGRDPVDYTEEVRVALEQQMREKEATKLTEVR